MPIAENLGQAGLPALRTLRVIDWRIDRGLQTEFLNRVRPSKLVHDTKNFFGRLFGPANTKYAQYQLLLAQVQVVTFILSAGTNDQDAQGATLLDWCPVGCPHLRLVIRFGSACAGKSACTVCVLNGSEFRSG